jgi:hypothetical protein
LIVLGLDDERLAALANPRRARLDVNRQCQLAVDGECAWRSTVAEEIDLVRQADADKRAARAFRAVLERWRDAPASGDETKPVYGGERL